MDLFELDRADFALQQTQRSARLDGREDESGAALGAASTPFLTDGVSTDGLTADDLDVVLEGARDGAVAKVRDGKLLDDGFTILGGKRALGIYDEHGRR